MNKQIVHFDTTKEHNITVGQQAVVFPFNHPKCSNTGYVLTSTVISIASDGSFETQNSLYIPMEMENAS